MKLNKLLRGFRLKPVPEIRKQRRLCCRTGTESTKSQSWRRKRFKNEIRNDSHLSWLLMCFAKRMLMVQLCSLQSGAASTVTRCSKMFSVDRRGFVRFRWRRSSSQPCVIVRGGVAAATKLFDRSTPPWMSSVFPLWLNFLEIAFFYRRSSISWVCRRSLCFFGSL